MGENEPGPGALEMESEVNTDEVVGNLQSMNEHMNEQVVRGDEKIEGEKMEPNKNDDVKVVEPNNIHKVKLAPSHPRVVDPPPTVGVLGVVVKSAVSHLIS